MFKSRRRKVEGWLLLSTVLIIGFQNCSQKANFSDTLQEGASLDIDLNNPISDCLFDNEVVQNGDSVVAYQLPLVASDQECLAEQRSCNLGQLTGSYQYSSCVKGSAPLGSAPPPAVPEVNEVLPLNFSIVHSNNNRSFNVNWTAGSGFGGAGSCRIEYRRKDGSWNSIKTANCDANGSAVGAVSLPDDGWYGGSWSSVQVRLVRSRDSSVVGTIGVLQCSSKAASPTSTQKIDENCNNYWNESTSASCEVLGPDVDGSVAIGSSYSVPPLMKAVINPKNSSSSYYQASANCSALADSVQIPVAQVIWYKLSQPHDTDSTCTKRPAVYGGIYLPVTTFTATGIVPSTCGGANSCVETGCFKNDPHGAGGLANDYRKWEYPGNFQDKYRVLYRLNSAVMYQ